MKTVDSLSTESSMDAVDAAPKHRRNDTATSPAATKRRAVEVDEEGDDEVWQTFDKSFRQVQSVLDRNRVLIQQVNENHQSRIPDNMVKNVALIQEINGNISKVVSLYSDLSTNFSGVFHQRNKADKDNGNSNDMA